MFVAQPSSSKINVDVSQDCACTICLEDFSETYVLICGHSFCKQCVEQLIRNAKEEAQHSQHRFRATPVFNCPECRKPVRVDDERKFTRNFRLEQVVHAMKQLEANVEESKPMVLVKVKGNTEKCNSCQEEHTYERLMMCTQCHSGPICGYCAVHRHHGHKLSDCKDLAPVGDCASFCLEAGETLSKAVQEINDKTTYLAPLLDQHECCRLKLLDAIGQWQPLLTNLKDQQVVTREGLVDYKNEFQKLFEMLSQNFSKLREMNVRHASEMQALMEPFEAELKAYRERLGKKVEVYGHNTPIRSDKGSIFQLPESRRKLIVRRSRRIQDRDTPRSGSASLQDHRTSVSSHDTRTNDSDDDL